jgi:hypothetical protein
VGIKVTTLVMCFATKQPVTVHKNGRKAEVVLHDVASGFKFGIIYLDDETRTEHQIVFDQLGQGYVEENGVNIETDLDVSEFVEL